MVRAALAVRAEDLVPFGGRLVPKLIADVLGVASEGRVGRVLAPPTWFPLPPADTPGTAAADPAAGPGRGAGENGPCPPGTEQTAGQTPKP